MSPNVTHQKLARRVEFELIRFVEQRGLGEVFDAPLDVHLSQDECVQPDIFFIAHENRKIIRDRIYGTPDLVVEILTDLAEFHELHAKRNAYEKNGVKELWIVDAIERSIEVLTNNNGRFDTVEKVMQSGPVRSKLLRDFGLIVEHIL